MPTHLFAAKILARVVIFTEAHDLGYVIGEQGGYEMSDDDTFAPDVAFISKKRLAEFPESGFINMPPDFAVEVVSPSDFKNKSECIDKKLKAYQDARVPLLWYVYPDRKEVEVYTLDQENQTVTKDGVLDGGDVLPDFRLPVAEIFR